MRFYNVEGDTRQSLIDSIHEGGQVACTHSDAVACLTYDMTWTDVTSTDPGSGACTVASVDLNPDYVMILPEWVGPPRVPQELVSWWKQVQDHCSGTRASTSPSPRNTSLGSRRRSRRLATAPLSIAQPSRSTPSWRRSRGFRRVRLRLGVARVRTVKLFRSQVFL